MRIALGLVLASFTLGGCTLYFGDDGEDPPQCFVGDSRPQGEAYSQSLRDPTTGQCQEFGNGGGGGGCYYDENGESCNCAYPDIAVAPLPDWGSCYSECESLSEDSCLETAGCNASYTLYSNADQASPAFDGCHATAPSGPVAGNCYNLDAQECSRHDDCAMIYDDYAYAAAKVAPLTPIYPRQFLECQPEPTTNGCSDVQCGPGAHCEQSCYEEVGDDSGSGGCVPVCVPDDNNQCAATTCGPGYTCVDVCETMDPSAANLWPGECYASCQPTTSCEALATETACAERGDCTNVYDGEDCTCYPGGYCDCATLTWDRCETVGVMPLPL